MNSVLFLISLLILMSGSVRANQSDNRIQNVDSAQHGLSQNTDSLFTGYFSFGAGYGDSSGSDNDKAEGAPSTLKLLGSYRRPNGYAVIDAGFGVHNHNFVHDLAQDKSISAGAVEFAIRYPYANVWQAGVIYNQVFNVGKNFYADQADVAFAGAQILREFKLVDGSLSRAGARFMNGLNINNEVFNMIMIDLQLGWPTF